MRKVLSGLLKKHGAVLCALAVLVTSQGVNVPIQSDTVTVNLY